MRAPTVQVSGKTQVITSVDAWTWRCNECGWLGVGHHSEYGALFEASNHYWDEHGIAVCAPVDGKTQFGHPGHRWVHLNSTDSVDRCDRCDDHIGK